ncbi:MAG TPA: VTT domain-containing protein [Candidatus Paceibacterota bacterium]|nr:VTT domain-containing protein [Candidatus Paceibacterota bacterium]
MELLFHFDLMAFAKTAGYIGIFLIVFAESGLFFGFFLPGDSLLFTAGLLASSGYFEIVPLVLLIFIAAIAGDQVGYWFGRKVGPRIFNKDDSFWFQKKHLFHAEEFYKKHGKETIIIARFIPIVRTFAPIVAGAGNMPYKIFVTYNIVGGMIWGIGVTLVGYFLGEIIPNASDYLLPIVLVIIFLSILPPLITFLNHKYKKNK